MTWNRPPRVCVCVCTCVKFGPMIYDRVVSGGFLSFDTADTQQRSGRSIGFDFISLVLLAAETRQSIYSVKTIETHQTLCQDSGRTESIASNPFHFFFRLSQSCAPAHSIQMWQPMINVWRHFTHRPLCPEEISLNGFLTSTKRCNNLVTNGSLGAHR